MYFDDFVKSVLTKIESIKKKLICKLSQVFSSDYQIMNDYNKASEKESLKKIINSFKENTPEKINNLK